MKLLIIIIICLMLNCFSTQIDSIIVTKNNNKFIDTWKQNGVKIIKIDTISKDKMRVWYK